MLNVERRGAVAILTLDRPEARNAINRALEQALYDALEAVDQDPEIRVGIIAASGPIFSAGADLKEIREQGNPRSGAMQRESIVSREHVKPLIAAIEGPALGGGAEIVLACDLVVAARGAKFALPEVRWGLMASGGAMFRLPRVIPKRIALQLLLTGASLTAERAYALGMINELTVPGDALKIALQLAEVIAENGPLAVQRTREIVELTATMSERDAWKASRRAVEQNFASDDAKEGPLAFAEKRKPRWRAR
jgi:enoyl-CoA hydratase